MLGFTSKNKIKIALLLFTILSLLLLNNLQERRMINRINENVVSIYEDRVVVGDYIVKLSAKIQEIIHLLQKDNLSENTKIAYVLGGINGINQLYDQTYLTKVERISFDEFLEKCKQIDTFSSSGDFERALKESLKAEQILVKLSSIQVEEGKNKLDEVLSLTGTGSFLVYLEIVILIIIAILIQWLVLSAKPLITAQNIEKHRMN